MKQPTFIAIPYDFDGILFNAYKRLFESVSDNDWVCFLDGDTAFLEMADFGHILSKYIKAYPDTGLFTAKATRCHYKVQMDTNVDMNNDSVKYLAQKVIDVQNEHGFECEEIDMAIAGHLIMMKKSVWNDILPILSQRAKPKAILGFDTQLCKSILAKGYKIRLMKGLLIFHYLRFLTGKNDKIV